MSIANLKNSRNLLHNRKEKLHDHGVELNDKEADPFKTDVLAFLNFLISLTSALQNNFHFLD